MYVPRQYRAERDLRKIKHNNLHLIGAPEVAPFQVLRYSLRQRPPRVLRENDQVHVEQRPAQAHPHLPRRRLLAEQGLGGRRPRLCQETISSHAINAV